jgi:3-deoxy-D-manno-octulosonic-acid transferase
MGLLFMYALYSALLFFSLILTLPYWLLQMMRHGKYRAGLAQRFGAVPSALLDRREGSALWVHAVSVGEVVASSAVIRALQEKFPSHRVFISTTTSTGQKLASQRFGPENVFYFPIDFAFAIQPYLTALRPVLVVVAETEFWPNFLRLAKRSGARVAVINCRISDRSLPGYKRFRFWLPKLLGRTLANVDLFLAQTDEDRRRLIEIGAEESKITVAGNLKFDIAARPSPSIVASLRESFGDSGAQPVLVCGSTLEDEEGALLSAFRSILANHPKAVMILAPRHPERFSEVAELVEKLGFRMWRRSLWRAGRPDSETSNGQNSTAETSPPENSPPEPLAGGVFLLDSIGELASLYSLATVAFVGGSLVPRGGHNILEPALYGVPIVTGNHYENFRDMVNFFAARNAVRIVGLAELPLVFIELIDSEKQRTTLGRNALAALESQRGATDRTVSALLALMEAPSGGAA